MPRLIFALIFATAAAGCAGKNYKADHPVVGPPPPRIKGATAMAYDDPNSKTEARGQSDIVQTALGADGYDPATEPLPMTAVAATVNGEPILVGTVLIDKRVQLEAVKSQLSPQQYRATQEELIKRMLPSHIEQSMMVHAVRLKLKDDQSKKVQEQVDKMFAGYVDEQVKKLNLNSTADFEAMIQRQGYTLPLMQKMFSDRALASQYIQAKIGDPPQVTAPELRAAYKDRQEEFTEPAQVKWQQIQVSYKNFDTKVEAEAEATKVMAALKKGLSFDDAAKKFSDGPDKANGGHWDWTQPESVAEELQAPLTELAIKTPSGIIATDKALQIVQVTERRPLRVKPFEEVQDQIRQDILNERHAAKAKQVLDELRSRSVVVTMFDAEQTDSSATPAENTDSPRAKLRFSEEAP
jgi:parvulin-like peptidyl-prolyl isomerase